VVGGVAAAVSREIGVQPRIVRASFLLLALVGGWGLVLYALTWLVLAVASPTRLSPYRPTPKGASPVHRHVAVAMVVLGLVIGLLPFTAGDFGTVVVPMGFVFLGALIAWSRGHPAEGGLSTVARVVAGLVVATGGVLSFAALRFNPLDAIVALVFGLAIVAGLGLVAAPSLIRLGHDLDDERQRRVRADERARISAHLHDSVLQTLSLIQREPDSERGARLARQQERELRNWLYGQSPSSPDGVRLGPALERVSAEIEDAHRVRIEVVTVGDSADLAWPQIDDLIAAAREAIVNAAQHAGVDRIDVFAERSDDRIEVFVRDTGIGFDPAAVPEDRKGVSESITARMARAGGWAEIHSVADVGTEVELSLPLTPTGEGSRGAEYDHAGGAGAT
jgi:signal transduction histidine kinase